MYKQLLTYVLLFVIMYSLNVLAGEASSVLPHNMSLPVLNDNSINFNSLNSGFTVLTFFMPNSEACLDVLKWTSELSNTFKNMKFYSISTENNKKLHSFVKKIKGIPPVLIDETNKLGTLFEVNTAPTIIIFKNGFMSIRKRWPIEKGKEELVELFKDVSEGKILPYINHETSINGQLFPYFKAPLLDGSQFSAYSMSYPSIHIFYSTKCSVCHKMLKQLIPLVSNNIFPDIYFIAQNNRNEVKNDDLLMKISREDNINIILDPQRKVLKEFKNKTGLTIKGIPAIMIVGDNHTVKWSKIGYNTSTFKNVFLHAVETFTK